MPTAAGSYVPGALERVASLGVTVEDVSHLFGSVRLRYFGGRPLTEDNSVRSRPTALLNGQAGVQLTNNLRLVADVFNLLDAKASDIDYFYTSRLQGEPGGGTDDTHTHPALPRSLRLGVEVRF